MSTQQPQPLTDALAEHGLLFGGGFVPTADDGVPPLPARPSRPEGQPVRWIALAGVAGSSIWPHFSAAPEYVDGQPDPLDRWSRRVGDGIAAHFGGVALFPFGGPPHWPFPRWAQRAEGLHASPIGLRLHPRYGLWHSYRFALALPQQPPDDPVPALDIDNHDNNGTDLCARCSGQPCLHACPVSAFTGTGYQVDVCAQHLGAQPEPPCRDIGCLARHACPVGQKHAPEAGHARFLMRAFLAGR